MDYSFDSDSQWPNQHDYDTLVTMYTHLDSYDSYDAPIGEEPTNTGCNAPPGKGCNKAAIGADAPMGVPVEIGLNYEIWVASDNAGGYWIHHVRTVPDEYRH